MSTRATIAVRRKDSFYDAAYLHFDGYPDHTGETLMQHHNTQSSAETLIACGDLRCLDRKMGTPERFADGRPPAILPTHDSLVEFAKNCGAQYVYVFDDGAWSCKEL